jgi:hypothetical protein
VEYDIEGNLLNDIQYEKLFNDKEMAPQATKLLKKLK